MAQIDMSAVIYFIFFEYSSLNYRRVHNNSTEGGIYFVYDSSKDISKYLCSKL